jgi:hypothetical protein
LTSATASPLRSPPHPLQVCRSNLSTTSLHLVGRVARSWSSHRRARELPFMVVLSAPEGWWSGGCGVPALSLKRGERGRVPASRRALLKFAQRRLKFAQRTGARSRIWCRLLHEIEDGRLMKMQARYTGPLKAARPPLSTTPYSRRHSRRRWCGHAATPAAAHAHARCFWGASGAVLTRWQFVGARVAAASAARSDRDVMLPRCGVAAGARRPRGGV